MQQAGWVHYQGLTTYLTANACYKQMRPGIWSEMKFLANPRSHLRSRQPFKSKDGRTLAEHEKIKSKIEKLLLTDPDDLLEEDVALLHEDVTELAEATAVDQEYWIASMETAVLAAYHKAEI